LPAPRARLDHRHEAHPDGRGQGRPTVDEQCRVGILGPGVGSALGSARRTFGGMRRQSLAGCRVVITGDVVVVSDW
jgi:hypothetical protein